jgi:hypothetical protein
MTTAVTRGDMPAVLGGMDPGIEWREAEGNPYEPGGKAWLGPDAVVQSLVMRLAMESDDFTVHAGEFHDAGDVVVVEGRSPLNFASWLLTGVSSRPDGRRCRRRRHSAPACAPSSPPAPSATRRPRRQCMVVTT